MTATGAPAAERLARALLYEGYVLYPYRPSSIKNRTRWTFGTLYPLGFCEAVREGDVSTLCAETLLIGDDPGDGNDPQVDATVRFLQLMPGPDEDATAQRGIERSIGPLTVHPGADRPLPAVLETELPDGPRVRVLFSALRLQPGLFRTRVEVENVTACDATDRRAALEHALVSAHVVLTCRGGGFVSLLEPAPGLEGFARECDNRGVWPVLVGEPGTNDTMLASPIVLYDRPRVADESPQDLFDCTEIDEILSLRILTLSEDERCEIRASDPRARALLERTENLTEEELLALHGRWRESPPRSRALRAGSRVVIRPKPGGDVLDLALAGERATVTSIEEDVEGRQHYAVTIDCDPGRDLGESGQPGHRFFFAADDLELVP